MMMGWCEFAGQLNRRAVGPNGQNRGPSSRQAVYITCNHLPDCAISKQEIIIWRVIGIQKRAQDFLRAWMLFDLLAQHGIRDFMRIRNRKHAKVCPA